MIGVILAAGGSRRMGRPKALLPLAGRPLIAHHEAALWSGCRQVRVVLGGWGPEIDAVLGPRTLRIHNPRWQETGPADSLLLALADLGDAAEPVVITPVDVPPAPPELLARLLQAPPPAAAAYGGVPGHPVLVEAGAARRALAAGGTLREALGPAPGLVEAGSADVLRNLNTPEDWLAWIGGG